MTDDCPMPWGKYKDTPMKNVPGDYLDWLYGQEWIIHHWGLFHYLRERRQKMLKEEKEQKDD